MVKRALAMIVAVAACCAGATAALSGDDPSQVAPPLVSSPIVTKTAYRSSLDQVRDLQKLVIAYGDELRQAAGGASPNPTTVRIGPAPCPGKYTDFASGGSFYVAGGWQLNLAPDRQIPVITGIRDSWRAKGFAVEYREFEKGRADLDMEDPNTGFELSVTSTGPPTAVAIRVLSTCVRPVDGKFPGDTATIYQ